MDGNLTKAVALRQLIKLRLLCKCFQELRNILENYVVITLYKPKIEYNFLNTKCTRTVKNYL